MAESCHIAGTPRTSDPRGHVLRIVQRSGSSFFWGMRLLPKARREAMYGIYAFCREVDDIADEPGTTEDKLARLEAWRAEIGRLYAGQASHPTARVLQDAVACFNLSRAEFDAILDGMEMDVRGEIQAPSDSQFSLYCRRVAGAVGKLSLQVFGADAEALEELAVVEGEALQITNILRDLHHDAALGRLYLPRDLLQKHGITPDRPEAVLTDPKLPLVCRDLAATAHDRFDRARQILRSARQARLRPAGLMLELYRRLLIRLEARGWAKLDERVRVPTAEKLWVVARYGLV